MPDMIRVEGGQKIALVGKALRHLGTDRTIVNVMTKKIRASSPEIRAAIKAEARKILPKRGGLNRWVAAANIRVSVTRTSRSAGVRIVVGRNSAHGRSDIRDIDAGVTRSPLWGHRKHWYPHAIAPGFASGPVHGDIGEQFRLHALEAIDTAVQEVLDVL